MSKPDNNPHGNNKNSRKPQHLYLIFITWPKLILYKIGISGSKLNKDGSSPRANRQVNRLNKKMPQRKFVAIVLFPFIATRRIALIMEELLIRLYRLKNGDNPDGNVKPKN